MDPDRLDTLARSLATAGSRRRLFGTLASIPLVRVLAEPEDASASARRRGAAAKRGKKHKRDNRPRPPKDTCIRTGQPCWLEKRRGKKGKPAGPAPCCSGVCEGGSCQTTSPHPVPCSAEQPCPEGQRCNSTGMCEDAGAGAACDTSEDCAGDLVCDCGQYFDGIGTIYCAYAKACRVNHAPVTFAVNLHIPSNLDFYAIFLQGVEPDNDRPLRFRIVTMPQFGYFDPLPQLGPVPISIDPGTTTALPAPPLPATADTNCFPRCLFDRSCKNADPAVCSGCDFGSPATTCPEGAYWEQPILYVPFSPTFDGTDTFTYSMVDVFGAEGPPAIFTLTTFEA